MNTTDAVDTVPAEWAAASAPALLAPPSRGRVSRDGGGTAGNQQLTATVGVVLIMLLAVMGVTILRIHQLLSVHMFVGFVLAGPIALKLSSVGYRCIRYYTGDSAYRRLGPPAPALRLLAPLVVASTVSLFASGLLLMLEGAHRNPQVMLVHKGSFVIWFGVVALHVLGHVRGLGRSLRAVSARYAGIGPAPGALARRAAIAGAIGAGVALALVMSSRFVS